MKPIECEEGEDKGSGSRCWRHVGRPIAVDDQRALNHEVATGEELKQ